MSNGHPTVKEEPKEETCQINVPNKGTVDAVELTFEQKNDPWIVVNLSDGTVLRIRLTLMKAYRILNEYNPVNGEPVYHLEPNLMLVGQVPAKLKKLPKPKPSSGQEIA